MEMERDKWKDTCMSTSKGLEGVLEERDSLKNELTSLTNENRQLKVSLSCIAASALRYLFPLTIIVPAYNNCSPPFACLAVND